MDNQDRLSATAFLDGVACGVAYDVLVVVAAVDDGVLSHLVVEHEIPHYVLQLADTEPTE